MKTQRVAVQADSEILNDLRKRGHRVELCGSRETCDPPPTTSDYDYLVEIIGNTSSELSWAVGYLELEGFEWEGSPEHYQVLAENSFMSWRRGDVNLIVTTNDEFAHKHRLATQVCTKLNIMNKEHRIMVFQAILYHNWYTGVL